MTEYITTKAIILKTSNLGEYDKRMVVLTAENGKITVFARGVRRQGSPNLASCSPFSYGQLRAFPGRNAYTMVDFAVENYFEALRKDFEVACVGMYFLEVADYYTRENSDDLEMMKLLYVALRALEKKASAGEGDLELIRYAYELKAIAVNGEFGGSSVLTGLSGGCRASLDHIGTCPLKALFAFEVSPSVKEELKNAAAWFRERFLKGNFKSLTLLE